ncbi:RALF-like protein 34 [Tanacetum coccineum]
MAPQSLLLYTSLTLCLILLSLPRASRAAEVSPTEISLNLPSDELSMYDDGAVEDIDGGGERRSLFWKRVRYYISYGALSANRVPCPPRSGRSYYTHDCWRARGTVHPYSRGCSAITRCRSTEYNSLVSSSRYLMKYECIPSTTFSSD